MKIDIFIQIKAKVSTKIKNWTRRKKKYDYLRNINTLSSYLYIFFFFSSISFYRTFFFLKVANFANWFRPDKRNSSIEIGRLCENEDL